MEILDRFARDEWNLGIVHQTIDEIVRRGITTEVTWFACNSWRILADPFCLTQPDGRLTIVAELMSHWTGRGEIWGMTIAADTNPRTARFQQYVAGPAHLSYPAYIQDGAVTYATLESYEAGGLFLWRIDNGQWRYERALLTGPVIDATVYNDGRLWWLFCAFANDQPDERLHLFFSESLHADWTPHPSNPVKRDRANARPAGSLFMVDGRLFRPAQNSTKTYGGSLVLNHVVLLTPTAFHEVPYRHILPQSNYYSDGVHTIAAAGDYTLIDGKRWHRGMANLPRVVVTKILKMRRKRQASGFPSQAILHQAADAVTAG